MRHESLHPPRSSALLFALLLVAACGGDELVMEPDPDSLLDMTGSWNPAFNFGGPWGHDGEPVESEHFLVFSGYASTEARQLAADIAEESMGEILETFSIAADDFGWLIGWEPRKIHILALAQQDFQNNAGFAYRDGLVIMSTEHANYRSFGYDETIYRRLIKHETFHVVEFLLIGAPQHQQSSDVWMREGMAHYVSRPRPSQITTRQAVDDWRADHDAIPDGGNPIAVHVWSDFPQEILDARQTFSYYDMFELAVRYLVDPDGHGATMQDIVDMYDAMGEGDSFEAAFQRHLGISVQDYQDNFWQLVSDYLDRAE